MIVTRTSQVSGVRRSLDLDITPEQMERYERGGLVQECFPHLPKDQREFIMTGITQEEWDELFKDEDQ